MNDIFNNAAPGCDDQMPLFAKVGRGPKGDSIELKLTDNKKDETYITCYSVDNVTGKRIQQWKTGNINAGTLDISEEIKPTPTQEEYLRLIFKRVRPNTSDNWTHTTPFIPISKAEKPSWTYSLSGEFDITSEAEGYNTTEITLELKNAIVGDTDPEIKWSVDAGTGIEIASISTDKKKCTFKAKPGSTYSSNTIGVTIGENKHHCATYGAAVITVGNRNREITFNESDLVEVMLSEDGGTTYTLQIHSGDLIPYNSKLRFKTREPNINQIFYISNSSGQFKYVTNRTTRYVYMDMVSANVEYKLGYITKPIRSVTFLVKNSSGQWEPGEIRLLNGNSCEVRADIEPAGTATGTWTTDSSVIKIEAGSSDLIKKITAQEASGHANIKFSMADVPEQFDASGKLISSGYQASSATKAAEVGKRTAKAVYNSSARTLKFYYDINSHTGEGTVYTIPTDKDTARPPWYSINASITSVTFDSAFKEFQPLTTANWFANTTSLTSINFTNLDVSQVVYMNDMFNSSRISTITWGGFNPCNCIDMTKMFYNMTNITKLTLPNTFNTMKVLYMGKMFSYCNAQEITLPDDVFDTRNVQTMENMFSYSHIKTMFLPNRFTGDNLTGSQEGGICYMFYKCAFLEYIYMPKTFTSSMSRDVILDYVFAYCGTSSSSDRFYVYTEDEWASWANNVSYTHDTFTGSQKASIVNPDGKLFFCKEYGDLKAGAQNCQNIIIEPDKMGFWTPYSRVNWINDEIAHKYRNELSNGKYAFKSMEGAYLECWGPTKLNDNSQQVCGYIGSESYKTNTSLQWNINSSTKQNYKKLKGNYTEHKWTLDVYNAMARGGQPVCVHSESHTGLNQDWIFIPSEAYPGYYYIATRGDYRMHLWHSYKQSTSGNQSLDCTLTNIDGIAGALWMPIELK